MIMYGEEIKFIKERHSAASVIFCVVWGEGEARNSSKTNSGTVH